MPTVFIKDSNLYQVITQPSDVNIINSRSGKICFVHESYDLALKYETSSATFLSLKQVLGGFLLQLSGPHFVGSWDPLGWLR